RDRARAPNVPAFGTIAKNRPYELDHYQINTAWEQLPFVVEGAEIGRSYRPPVPNREGTYQSPQELIDRLEQNLGPMELSLAIQYLYALFTLRDPSEVDDDQHRRWPALRDDLKAARQFILMVAVSEMTHLRWVNQILWELDRHGVRPGTWRYRPIVDW